MTKSAFEVVIAHVDDHIAWCKQEKEQEQLEFACEVREYLHNMHESLKEEARAAERAAGWDSMP